MATGTVHANAIELWYETLGHEADPPTLLIMGQGGQATGWPTALCRRLAATGRFVVRFDNRDTGYSTWPGDGRAYSLEDMAADAAGLLDALGLARAHIVGASLGGAIGQILAIDYPDRVRSLTSIMAPAGNTAERTSPADAALLDRFERERQENGGESIHESVESWRLCAGRTRPFDEEWWWSFVAEQHGRRANPSANAHHRRAAALGRPRHASLRGIRAPAVIVHGDEDPLVPVEEARVLAALIPGAELVIVPGMGHELPPWTWDTLIAAAARAVARA